MPVDVSSSAAPSASLMCTGLPSLSFNASPANMGMTCVQTDGQVGMRWWFCSPTGWELIRGICATTVSAPISVALGFTVATATYTSSVVFATASVGMTVDILALGMDIGLVNMSAWVATAGVINFRITNLALVNTAISNATLVFYLRHP